MWDLEWVEEVRGAMSGCLIALTLREEVGKAGARDSAT